MAEVEFKPLSDKIVVKPQARVKSSILQVVMNEADNMGTVVAVGPGKKISATKREPMPVSVGDFVRFGTMGKESKEEYLKYHEHYENGERYLIMSWQDICWIQGAES